MNLTQQELALRLRRSREASGLTQEEVARQLGVSRPTVAQIEGGQRSVSGLELDQLARLYGRDIRELLGAEFRPEDSLVALFRAEPGVAERDEVTEAIRGCIALSRDLSELETLLGLDRSQLVAPAYPVAPPKTKGQAIEQGSRIAAEERRRLGLGLRPVGDLSELLEGQGVRTGMLDLPDDISGLTLMEPRLSLFVVANRRHHLLRRRFSWVHEYAHVLLDRDRKGTLSRSSNRDDLSEVRANAFAAAFLLPEDGVRSFLAELGKGQPSRARVEVFDGAEALPAEVRLEPRSQLIQLYDVVLLAHHFRVSRAAALYRLLNLHLISESEQRDLSQEEREHARALAARLGLPEPPHNLRDEFRSRFLGMALEAYRREKISRAKLRELGRAIGVSVEDMQALLEEAGLAEQRSEPLLPEGLA